MHSTKRSVFLFVTTMAGTMVLLQVTPAEATYRRVPARATCLSASDCPTPNFVDFVDDSYFDHTNVAHIWVDNYFPYSSCNALYLTACATAFNGVDATCNSNYEIGPTNTSGWINADLCSNSGCTSWSNTGYYAFVSWGNPLGTCNGSPYNGAYIQGIYASN